MAKQVFSTLTTDQNYSLYRKAINKGEPNVLEVVDGKPAQIKIKGGHGVAGEYFQTPEGVCTEVSDQAHAMLETSPMFKRHLERGYIKVHEKKIAPEKVAKDMEAKDGSAPLVDGDFEQGKAPTTEQVAV